LLSLGNAYIIGTKHVVAVVLLAAAILKIEDCALGTWMPELPLAGVEAVLASLLVFRSGPDWRPLGLALAFFVTSSCVAMWRAAGASGLEGDCGCLGDRLPLRVWHQLILSGSMSVMVGGALFLISRPAAGRSERPVGGCRGAA
jgi:hypothetical protein